MKRSTLKRKTPLRKKSKAQTIGWWQKKCDALLTPIIKLISPRCECCGQPTQVAHHWIEKGRCSFLRYNFTNLVALCNKCHLAIHNRFGNNVMKSVDVAGVIIQKRGEEWKTEMDRLAPTQQKVNIGYYKEKLPELQAKLSDYAT